MATYAQISALNSILKAPNSKEIDQFTREQPEGRVSNRKIGWNLIINYQTVKNMVNKWKSEGLCRVKQPSGRLGET